MSGGTPDERRHRLTRGAATAAAAAAAATAAEVSRVRIRPRRTTRRRRPTLANEQLWLSSVQADTDTDGEVEDTDEVPLIPGSTRQHTGNPYFGAAGWVEQPLNPDGSPAGLPVIMSPPVPPGGWRSDAEANAARNRLQDSLVSSFSARTLYPPPRTHPQFYYANDAVTDAAGTRLTRSMAQSLARAQMPYRDPSTRRRFGAPPQYYIPSSSSSEAESEADGVEVVVQTVPEEVLPAQTQRPSTPYGTWVQGDDAKWRLGDDITDLQLEAVQRQIIDAEECRQEREQRQRDEKEQLRRDAEKKDEEAQQQMKPRDAAARAAMARAKCPDPITSAGKDSGAAGAAAAAAAPAHDDSDDEEAPLTLPSCSICMTESGKMAFRCGHVSTCRGCYDTMVRRSGGTRRQQCPICRRVTTPIEIFA